MPKISSSQFGLIVAFLIPGFIGLTGVAPLMPIVGEWLRPVNLGNYGIGPTVCALMAATAVGMILSCVRWLVVDHLLEWSGIRTPASVRRKRASGTRGSVRERSLFNAEKYRAIGVNPAPAK